MTLSPSPSPVRRAPRPVGRALPSRLLLGCAVALGAGGAVLGTWLLAHPGADLLQDEEAFLVRAVLGPTATAVLIGALGLLGALGALLALTSRAPSRPTLARPVLLGLAGLQVAGSGVALQSVTTISLAGYLLAASLPLLVVALLVLALWRRRRLGWPLLALVVGLLLWGVTTGTLSGGALGRLGGALAGGFAAHALALVTTVLTGAVTAVWVLVLLPLVRGSATLERAGRRVLRHRRGLTLVAAAGPLPYALVRATWLTPWPLVAPDEDLPPEVRLWGLLLGGAALLGCVLTLGLVSRWGEVVPAWVPGLGGRPVPVRAAVLPGGLVAGILCAAAVPMLRLLLLPAPGGLTDRLPVLERVGTALVFPFWAWGPALALAVWGYARHRAATDAGAGARG